MRNISSKNGIIDNISPILIAFYQESSIDLRESTKLDIFLGPDRAFWFLCGGHRLTSIIKIMLLVLRAMGKSVDSVENFENYLCEGEGVLPILSAIS